MGILLVFLSLMAIPAEDTVRRVDVVELNHFYDDQGRLVFDQLIFWRWYPYLSNHHVVAWVMFKNKSMYPRYDYNHRRWMTNVSGIRISSVSFRETWTQFDPELLDRDKIPKNQRPELLKSD